MNNGRYQGSVGGGVFFIIFSLVFMGVGFWMLSSLGFSSMTSLMFVFMIMIGAFTLVVGIMAIRRGKIDQKVAQHGKRSTCIVSEFRVIGHRYGHSIWMDVIYKDEHGIDRRYSAKVGTDAITNLKKGMRIECFVLGNECYVDPNNIRVVDEDTF